MRGSLQAIFFVLIVVIVALLYKLPANFVYQQFSNTSLVRLSGVSGSIWSGHVASIDTGLVVVEKIDWQLSPLSLLLGDVAIEWRINDPAIGLAGEALLTSEELTLSNVKGQIDVFALAQKLPPQEILLGGIVNIDITTVAMINSQLENIEGIMSWTEAELLSPENVSLGQFEIILEDNSGSLLGKLSDTGGAIELLGDMSFTRNGQLQYALHIAVRDTSVPNLLNGFNQLGQTDENGKIWLRGSHYLY